IGEKKEGHQSCKCKYCPWSQTRGEPNSIEAHLALSCHKVPHDVKEKFLLIVKTHGEIQTEAAVASKKRKSGHQQLITKYGESDTIEPIKKRICDCTILDESPEKLSADISELIRSRSFFTNVEAVNTLLGPVKSVVKSLEFKTTTLADCFVELIKLSQKIKSLPPVSDYDFKYQCVERFNKRWKEFDIQLYLLAYILHPHYRGKGLRPTVLRNVYILAMEIWINMGGGELSSADLISQIQSFYLRKEEYNIPFSTNKGDVLTWWLLCNPVRSEENHIQKLALKILAITPHNAGCVSEDDFQSSIREALSEANKSDNEKGNHDPKIPNLRPNQRDIDIERWVDINDSELKRLLNIEVNVVIEPHPLPVINHGSNVFDIEATVDKILGS
ncbi:17844_t:CDS:2, partial [Rhizophagus irregularis]